MKKRRRQIFLLVGSLLAASALALAIGIVTRKKTAFSELYSLATDVGARSPGIGFVISSSGGPGRTVYSVATIPPPGRGSATPDTVLVFDSKNFESVKRIVDARLKNPQNVITGLGSRSTVPSIMVRTYGIGQEHATLLTGTPAESTAKAAKLKMPAGGFVVVLSEAPDWLTVKLNAVLRTLGMR